MVKPDRSRYIWLYFKSKAQKDEWQALAEKTDTPLSTWCASIIEEGIAENEEHRPRHKIAKELEKFNLVRADGKGWQWIV